MKSIKNQILTLSLIFFVLKIGYTQDTVTVKLLVDTVNFNADNLSTSCSFEAEWSNSGQVVSSNGNLEDFTIEVNVGDIIVWEAISSTSETDIIDVKRIARANNSRIFNNDNNNGQIRGNSNKETVEDQVLFDTTGKPDYKYNIFFKINRSGPTHKIDPKIRVGK
jgi:hypothetical protein